MTNIVSDPKTQQRIAECGRALAIACARATTVGNRVDVPTMVAACARMSGNYLLRSFCLDLSAVPPGQVVLSAEAGEKTSMLVRFCASMLQTVGTPIDSPPTSLDASRIKQDFIDTQRKLEPAFGPLKQQYGLDDEQMAKAAALATGTLIHQAAKHVDRHAAFGYAVYGFMEGARTAPLHLRPGGDAA